MVATTTQSYEVTLAHPYEQEPGDDPHEILVSFVPAVAQMLFDAYERAGAALPSISACVAMMDAEGPRIATVAHLTGDLQAMDLLDALRSMSCEHMRVSVRPLDEVQPLDGPAAGAERAEG